MDSFDNLLHGRSMKTAFKLIGSLASLRFAIQTANMERSILNFLTVSCFQKIIKRQLNSCWLEYEHNRFIPGLQYWRKVSKHGIQNSCLRLTFSSLPPCLFTTTIIFRNLLKSHGIPNCIKLACLLLIFAPQVNRHPLVASTVLYGNLLPTEIES